MMRLLDGLKIVPPTLIRALGLMLPLSVIHVHLILLVLVQINTAHNLVTPTVVHDLKTCSTCGETCNSSNPMRYGRLLYTCCDI